MIRILAILAALTFVVVFALNILPKSELEQQVQIERIMTSTGKFEDTSSDGIWDNAKVTIPTEKLMSLTEKIEKNVLGTNSTNRWIEIDLSKQLLFGHEGDRVAFTFPVSSGLPWTPTVTGNFTIWAKIRSQRMTGGSIQDGSFYDLPNVPFVQYFYKAYGLHGAYWHNDFGKPRSHGCINLSPENARDLYYWTNPVMGETEYANINIPPEQSTRVVIHGETPTENIW